MCSPKPKYLSLRAVFTLIFASVLTISLQANGNHSLIDLQRTYKNYVPSEYSLLDQISIQFKVGVIKYSPDQNWIIYTKQKNQDHNNRIYLRPRLPSSNYSFFTFGNDQSQSLEFCRDCLKFNPQGDTLFFGTNKRVLYGCNFTYSMTSRQCQASINLNLTEDQHIKSIGVNKQNKVSIVINDYRDDNDSVIIIDFNGKQFTNKDTYQFGECDCILWHPKNEQIVMFLVYYIAHAPPGIYFINIAYINTTEKTESNLTQITTFPYDSITQINLKLEIFNEGRIIFVNAYNGIHACTYSQGKITLIGNIYEYQYQSIKVSTNGKFLVGQRLNKSLIELLKINITNFDPINFSHRPLFEQDIQYQTSQMTIYLTLICNISQTKNISFSSNDINQILIVKQQSPLILMYTLCPNKTYLLNTDCVQCSNNCSECHITGQRCLSCPNNSYVLQNSVCYPCLNYINNCSTCEGQQKCLSCLDFYFVFQNICKPCDNYGACKNCTSENNCTKCDSDKGYQEHPINSSCKCKQNYSFYDHKCVQCSVIGCISCQQHNKCSMCDSTKGYNQTSNNGICQCQKNFTQFQNRCVECNLEACIKCEQENKCTSCIEDQYDLNPDGQCIPKQTQSSSIVFLIGCGLGGIIIIGIGIAIYCKFKKGKQNIVDPLDDQRQSESVVSIKEKYEQIIFRSILEDKPESNVFVEQVRIKQPLIGQQKQYAKYSDEEKIRLKRLEKSSLISN